MESGTSIEGAWLRSVLEWLALFAFLFAFWLALSDHYDVPHLLIGAGCAALVTSVTGDRLILWRRHRPEFGVPLGRLSPVGICRYALLLLSAIVQANLQVAYVVLHPKMPIDPKLLRFRVGFEKHISQVVLAHSITLTPGTVTIDLKEGSYLVHSLVPRSAEELVSGRMQQGVAAALGEERGGAPAVEWIESVHQLGEPTGEEAVP